MKRPRLSVHAILFAATLLVTCLVYRTGLGGGFVFDDAGNIEFNPAVHLTSLSPDALARAAFSGTAGPLKRPLSMLSFGLNHYFAGAAPYGYKIVNLAIHLATGVALYWLGLLLLRADARARGFDLAPDVARWTALGAAAVWLLHPVALTSVLYVVQRMTSLSALFTALGLIGYLAARERMRVAPGAVRWAAASLATFTMLAGACKETGLLLPLLALVCEATILRFAAGDAVTRRQLTRLFGLFVGLPLGAFAVYVAIRPEYLLSGYRMREFDLAQRLMTEARVVWTYVRMVLLPDIRALGLFHDDFAISTSLGSPNGTLAAVLSLPALAAVAWGVRRRLPWVAFGILFFLVGHALESTVFALELMHEHRNYLPMFGLILCAVASMADTRVMHDTAKLRAGLVGVLVVLLGAATAMRASYWNDPVTLAEMEAEHHPGSPRAHYEVARQYDFLLRHDKNPIVAEIDYRTALRSLYRAEQAQSDFSPAIVGRLLVEGDHGTKPDAQWFAQARERLARAPYSPDLVDLFRALADCQRDGPCEYKDEDVVSLYDAVLSNPRLHGQALAGLLTSASDYVATRSRNLPNALDLAYAATRAAPSDPRYHLNLVVLLVAAHKLDAARAEIQTTKSLDRFDVLRDEIRTNEGLLAGAERGGRS